MNEKELQKQLQIKVKKKLEPLFAKYKMDFGGISAALKWKPIVLIIGNYSSGKSTLINELVGQHVQRTGQAPTDDSFTIITCDKGIENAETPGSTLVNDENLPFGHFKQFGEKLISHICMKQISSPKLENMAIIDSPGMIDATSENNRGYDYMKVLGEFAKMADLIVLMFDPHKAGTIKESYDAIRTTLPEKSGEHRIVFVMSRIDECDNLSDFTRSYGTLCWNMSQMTGRKDIPHIYLTYSPTAVAASKVAEGWPQERDDLLQKIMNAPGFRINHILEDIDRQVNEVQIVAQAVGEFLKRTNRVFWKFANISMGIALVLFLFGDILLNTLIAFPDTTLIASIKNGSFDLPTLVVPGVLALMTLLIGSLAFSKIAFKRQLRKALANGSDLVTLDNDYRKNLWRKMESKVLENLRGLSVNDLWGGYGRSQLKIENFLNYDLKKYYEKIVN
ncbi:MAG: dynamin family protein [Desulfobulbaceae bacterium BRH_c16a]|nr:MAG: dynamin family protein [Desulfobulbaceae bacterium BRH_c16a]